MRARYARTSAAAVVLPLASASCRSPIGAFSMAMVPSPPPAGLMHSYTVFLVAFIEEFRWNRAETSVAYSVSQLVAGASSPLVGALVDRLGPRRLLLLGGSLLVLGLLASAFITALWQIILLY